MSILERIKARVKINENNCWEWQGERSKNGYGRMMIKNVHKSVHRVMYEECFGKIPDGMFVCHHCDNPPCCNPDHLFAGTCKDNFDDMYRKGRGPTGAKNGRYTKPESRQKGEKNGRAKITEHDVVAIRKKYIPRKYSYYKLAKEYGLNPTTIMHIVSGKLWGHIKAL